MKITNEVKVGLLAIAAIIVLVIGFNFLKGSSFFSKPFTLYAHFPNIGSLEKSNDVKINGLTVGKVYNYKAADKEVNSITVEIRIDKDIAIPKNSVAFIDGSVLGSPYINVQKGTAGDYLKSGDSISTKLEMGLLGGLQAQVAPTITRLNETFDSLKLVIGGLNSIFDPSTKNNLRSLITNLTLSSAQLNQLLNAQSGALAQSLGNMNAITANLAKNNDAITSSIRNVEVTTSHLAGANIEGMVSALQSTINQLQSTIGKFNNNNGTLGLLMNDRGLYDKLEGNTTRLNQGLLSLEILLDDIRVHPKRYLNISVFGGKKAAEPITSPAAKDTVRVKY
ncbi:MlaD family protein [Flavisolibacter ginsenosidimutans]|uniref:MCE family protein n=1 Tax=Flavisolibacter ginsenosidimutans TaxID=661481 RepID=A0A5B8UGY2_9BACT|nr:MlaD family protein [Flavisolibacter ginsenosidimutans]QEC55586.1 MCE family protein [Flavisolibacter ginsenosidimutans]